LIEGEKMENLSVKSPPVKKNTPEYTPVFTQEPKSRVEPIKPAAPELKQWMSEVEQEAKKLSEGFDHLVKNYPLRVLGAVVSTGFVLNRLVRKIMA
jgi:hypothetical protein